MEAAKEITLYALSDRVKENKETGFISIYRSIREHWTWKESRIKSKFEAWMDLLLLASHDDQKEPVGYDMIIVKKGQVLTSQLSLSTSWAWDRSAVRGFLRLLQKDKMISVKATSKFTMITICNYEGYQSKRPTKQQQNNNRTTTTQHIQPLEPLEPLFIDGAEAPKKPKSFKQWSDQDFKDELSIYLEDFGRDTLNAFYKHWSEKSATGKMKLQLQKTWETKKRLDTWISNQDKWSK